MAQNKKYEIDMCNGPLLGKILLFAIPLMFSGILQLLFNAADIIVVGRFAGDNALAAVGSTSSLINLIVNVFIGLSVGVNVLVARFVAAGDRNRLKATIDTAVYVSVFSGIFLSFVGCFGAKYFLTWMGSPKEVLPLSTTYLRIYFLGMIAMLFYNFGAAILRAVGDTRRPLYYLIIAGIINVVLNLIFVIVFNMGVAGVAIATVASQTVSALLVLICLLKDKGNIHLDIKSMRFDKKIFAQIARIGLPAGFQGLLFSFSNVIIQSSINSFGNIVVAGNSAASNIEGFPYIAMNAFHQASISFTSQNYGAGKYERINKVLIQSLICVTVVGLAFGNLAYFFSKPLLGLYTSNADVIAAGQLRMLYICAPYFLCGVMEVFVGSLRGLGYSVMPMIVSLLGACALRLIWIFTFFQMDIFHKPQWLYITYPVSWIVTVIAHMICFIVVRKRIGNNKY